MVGKRFYGVDQRGQGEADFPGTTSRTCLPTSGSTTSVCRKHGSPGGDGAGPTASRPSATGTIGSRAKRYSSGPFNEVSVGEPDFPSA